MTSQMTSADTHFAAATGQERVGAGSGIAGS